MRKRWGDSGVWLNNQKTEQKLPYLLYVGDSLLLAELEMDFGRTVRHFEDVFRRSTLKVIAYKSKVLVKRKQSM